MVNKVGPRICHVYAQSEWHADAKIVGTFEAFRVLRDALHDVMYDHHRGRVGLFTQDGEAYDLVLELDNSDWQSESWKSRPVPYTRDYARGAQEPTREQRLEEALRGLLDTEREVLDAWMGGPVEELPAAYKRRSAACRAARELLGEAPPERAS